MVGHVSAPEAYASDISNDEQASIVPYLTLMAERPLREVFNGMRYMAKTGAPCRRIPSTCHFGAAF